MIKMNKNQGGKRFFTSKTMWMTAFMLISSVYVSNAQKCITDQVNYDILKQNAEMMKKHQSLYENVPNHSSAKRATKYIIPVVFHVIHTNGEENISKAQIDDQIRLLNLDYSFNNPNKSNIRSIFTGVAADMEIEFRLAKIDPQGNCTDGINRVYSSKTVNAHDQVKSLPLARSPNQNYLNIWVVSNINSAGAAGTILGYAYFPTTSDGVTYSTLDGIVIRADYVGSIGTSNTSRAGRTLTHEVGHYLGLLHPFQDSCDGGDHCDDTPPVISTFTNANCNPNVNSCHNDNPDLPDMFENFMDYSEGYCQAMFTMDQRDIVHETFTRFEHRAHLVSMENLIATGVVDRNIAPLAGFTASTRLVCAGKSVTFNEIACVSPVSSRSWTFEGASITTSSSANPTVTYAQPGFYKVSLTVNNPQGTNTLTQEEYIQVLPGEAIDKGALRQTFESPDFEAGEGWQVVSEQGMPTFTRVTGVSYSGNASLKASIDGFTRIGKRFRIISPKVDLRPLASMSPKLSFMCAYAKPNLKSKETLRVFSSSDCGVTWVQRYFRQDANLYSTSQPELHFIPTQPSQWRQHTISLSFLASEPNIMFMIEVESDAGGPVYIDNINVGQFNTSVDVVNIGKGLELYPVPSKDEVNLVFEAAEAGLAEIVIINTLGQVVMTRSAVVSEGSQKMNLQFENQLTTGIYFIAVKIGSETFINKMVVESSN